MRVAVLGPGGVGGFVTAALERAGTPVTLVAREETADALREGGLTVDSRALGARWEARPTVVTALDEPVDLLLVATKATGLDAALDRVATPAGLVLPLLNGLEHMATLRARFGTGHVAAAAIRVQSDRPRTGAIVQDSAGARIDIADGPATRDLRAAAALLHGTGIEVRLGGSEADVLWAKLARLNAIAATTTAHAMTLGEIRAAPRAAADIEAAVRETVAVAVADGARVDVEATLAELAALRDDQSSSMARDVAAGRPPELDAICGAVLRAGARHGVACPTVERLAARIAARLSA